MPPLTRHDDVTGVKPVAASALGPLSLEVRVRRRMGAFTLDVAFDVPAPRHPSGTAGTGGRGAITALVGPSGAGKTLTLRAVAGLLRPDAGRIVCAGRVLFDAAPERPPIVDLPARARNVGLVFQQGALFPHLTVAGNVAYGLHDRPRAAREARVAEVLALAGLSGYAERRPGALSGGEQQRVALARALAPEPALLLLDEPFAALDAPLRARLGDALRALHARTRVPMLLVTHDLTEARRVADAMVHLDAGRVVATETPPADALGPTGVERAARAPVA